MKIDVTDATFEVEVIERSRQVPVVVDLWAPWCGPCRQLGPLIEKVVDATDGKVILTKVDIDENPQIAKAFKVQSIPAVYAMRDGKPVDGFMGAQGEAYLADFVSRLLPTEVDEAVEGLLASGDEASLRQILEMVPDHEQATLRLAELLLGDERVDDALGLLDRLPDSPELRRIAAIARTGAAVPDDQIDDILTGLLDRVKGDDDARREFLDLLERLGPDDPRTADYRRRLTTRLY